MISVSGAPSAPTISWVDWPAGANRGEAGRGIGFKQAEKQQWQFLFQSLLGIGRQLQALARAVEVDVHDDGGGQALDHRGSKCRDAVEGLCAEAEKFQLAGQAFSALMVLEEDVDRFAQRRQKGLFKLIALAQAGARQTLHQAIEVSDQGAAQASAIGIDCLQCLADAVCQPGVFGLGETLGEPQQAQVGFAEFGKVGA